MLRDLASLQTIAQSEPALAQQPQLLLLEFLRQRHQHAGGPCEAQQPGTGRHDLEQPPLLRQVERAAHRGVLQTGKVNCGAVGLEAVFPVEEPGPHHDFRNVDQHDQPTGQDDAGHAHHKRIGSPCALLESRAEVQRRDHAEAVNQQADGDQPDAPNDFLHAGDVIDLFDQDVKLLAVDSKKLHKEIINYLKVNSPHLIEKVELYNGDRPIFEAFGIEKELAKTFRRTVNLPSGGDVVFDHTEAMHVIDVNSGRSNETDQEKNAFKTNIEAANEIARQIRLRDLSGMIIIDFIDMQQENNKKKLFQEMTRLLAKDRAKTVCFPLTQLGLMQITRQRINQNLEEKTSEICHVCNGTGRIISKAVLINTIERWLKNFRKNSREFKLILQVHPNIATYITEGTFSIISRLMLKYFVKITVQQSDTIGIDKFRFISVRKDKDITNEFM